MYFSFWELHISKRLKFKHHKEKSKEIFLLILLRSMQWMETTKRIHTLFYKWVLQRIPLLWWPSGRTKSRKLPCKITHEGRRYTKLFWNGKKRCWKPNYKQTKELTSAKHIANLINALLSCLKSWASTVNSTCAVIQVEQGALKGICGLFSREIFKPHEG